MASVPSIRLDNGVDISQLGFGVYQIPPAETADAVAAALEIGYRHIDISALDRNQRRGPELIGVAR